MPIVIGMNGHRMDAHYVVFVEQLDISRADADFDMSVDCCDEWRGRRWRAKDSYVRPQSVRWTLLYYTAVRFVKRSAFRSVVLLLDSAFVNPHVCPRISLEFPRIPTTTLDKGSRRKRSEIWPYAWVMKFRNQKMKLFPYSWKIVRQPYSRTPWKENPRSTPIFFFRGRG